MIMRKYNAHAISSCIKFIKNIFFFFTFLDSLVDVKTIYYFFFFEVGGRDNIICVNEGVYVVQISKSKATYYLIPRPSDFIRQHYYQTAAAPVFTISTQATMTTSIFASHQAFHLIHQIIWGSFTVSRGSYPWHLRQYPKITLSVLWL